MKININTDDLVTMRESGMTFPEIAAATGMLANTIQKRVRNRIVTPPPPQLAASPFPAYNKPLTIEGDALILNDLEVPFHAADFVNRCLDLAHCWGVTQLILGGDVMHFDTLSAWGRAWQEERKPVDVVSVEKEAEIRAKICKLPPEFQGDLLEELNLLAENREAAEPEIRAGAKQLKLLATMFTKIYYVLGNHDDRFIRKLQAEITPDSLLAFLGLTDPAWCIAPYFYAVLNSGGEKWRIEHQRSAAPGAAVRLADKNECHVIVAHNHSQSVQWSTSGHYYAISSGCACDEALMAYAAQRSTQRPAHHLGAVIVRRGIPFVLHPRSPWEMYKRM